MSAQSMKALARADEVRFGRAKVKRTVREGRKSIEDALTEDCCRSMLLADLLGCQLRWGPLKTSKTLRRLEIGEGVTVGVLTGHQRALVAAACPVSKPVVVKPAVKRPPVRARLEPPTVAPPRCCRCKARLRVPAEMCGFCAAEAEEPAA